MDELDYNWQRDISHKNDIVLGENAFLNRNFDKLVPLLEEIARSNKSIENYKNSKDYARISDIKKKAITDLLYIVKNVCKPTRDNLMMISDLGKHDTPIDTVQIIKEINLIKQKNEKNSQSIVAQNTAIQK